MVRPGDCLYLPAFWWHEVESTVEPEHASLHAINANRRLEQQHTATCGTEHACDTHRDPGAPGSGAGHAADGSSRLVLAVNFWYAPLLQKDHPCSGCSLRFDGDAFPDMMEKLALWHEQREEETAAP